MITRLRENIHLVELARSEAIEKKNVIFNFLVFYQKVM